MRIADDQNIHSDCLLITTHDIESVPLSMFLGCESKKTRGRCISQNRQKSQEMVDRAGISYVPDTFIVSGILEKLQKGKG